VRACELRAMTVQDKVFAEGPYADPGYSKRRANLFIVAVNCGSPAGACFCVSMGAGPKARSDYDLALTEVCGEGRHYFVVECGSAQGKAVLDRIPHRAATDDETRAADVVIRGAEEHMGRTLDTTDIRDLLYRNAQGPRWEETAKRCLACANCTMVCPTCFCSTVEDTTSLSGDNAERWRVWDSCFTIDFSHIHGGSVRKSASSRYRQWITHKLASWHDQFGSSGCVGCGRCITWCPVGIDITEEVAALRQAEADTRTAKKGVG
jgi:formate hydrogenlyase subunit 6/NADH:ubiquinone oxidoreductase subunit I